MRGTGQGVQHDVDAVAVGVPTDLLGELGAAGIVDMLDTHVAQHLSTLLITRGGEDLGARRSGDTDCGLAHTAGCGVDQDPVAGFDTGLIMQAEPGGGGGRGDGDRLLIGHLSRERGGQARVAGDKRSPTAVL